MIGHVELHSIPPSSRLPKQINLSAGYEDAERYVRCTEGPGGCPRPPPRARVYLPPIAHNGKDGQERCHGCGTPVGVVFSKKGAIYYQPVQPHRVSRVIRDQVVVAIEDALGAWESHQHLAEQIPRDILGLEIEGPTDD